MFSQMARRSRFMFLLPLSVQLRLSRYTPESNGWRLVLASRVFVYATHRIRDPCGLDLGSL